MEVKGKAVFVTGGSKGIGRALSEALLKKGAKVFFCDINEATGEATAAELQKQYGAGNVIFAKCDVTDADRLTDVFKKAVDAFGHLDICVNNAGIADERIWERMIAINMISHIRGSQLAIEHMRRDKGGRGGVIINIVSIAGLLPTTPHPVYNATKHAMVGYTQSWAMNPEMKTMGIRWGCLCPAHVDTDMTTNLQEGQVLGDLGKYSAFIAENKMQLEPVAEAFMTLVEDDDSNGAIITLAPFFGGTKIKKRQLVDSDGVSDPVMVDVYIL